MTIVDDETFTQTLEDLKRAKDQLMNAPVPRFEDLHPPDEYLAFMLPVGGYVEFKDFKFEHNKLCSAVILPRYHERIVFGPDTLRLFDDMIPELQDALETTDAEDRMLDDGCPNVSR